jgi:hypothetical protein
MQKSCEENIKKDEFQLTKSMDDAVVWNLKMYFLRSNKKGREVRINGRDRMGGEGCT